MGLENLMSLHRDAFRSDRFKRDNLMGLECRDEIAQRKHTWIDYQKSVMLTVREILLCNL